MALSIKDITKKYKNGKEEISVLDGVNLEIQEGEFICILGPSGCGKSTLLKLVAGLIRPTSGKVLLDGAEVSAPGTDRIVMFQESALFPWLTVIQNVEYGLKIARIPKDVRREKALKYLKMVHLTKFQNSYIHELSGGMKQRVALARALTFDSKVLLMDEPFAALDSQTKSILQLELQKIWLEAKNTVFFITHNVEEAVLLADRVIVMGVNPGKIKKEFAIHLARPRSVENIEVAYVAADIMKTLKEEVEKVAKNEYDSDWSIEKNNILYNTNTHVGSDL